MFPSWFVESSKKKHTKRRSKIAKEHRLQPLKLQHEACLRSTNRFSMHPFKETPELNPLRLSKGVQYGFAAQEVEAIFPEFVNDHVYPGETDIDGNRIGEPISVSFGEWEKTPRL
jgi:hypothetical protein